MSSGAGEFDQEIIFEVKTSTQNAAGELIDTWVTDFHEWAACEAIGSREFRAVDKQFAETTMRFRIRFREPQPGPGTHRINWRGRYFDIKPPMEVERRRELHIEATEIP